MNNEIVPTILILILSVTAPSHRRPQTSNAAPKPLAARFTVEGTYEETYQGRTEQGSAEGKLVIKFQAARWLTMSTNEVGNAEFSDLVNAPVPSVSGSAAYDGRVRGASAGNSYDALSSFAGALSGDAVVLSVPENTNTGNGFKIRVFINPKLKGKCSFVEVRDGATGTSNDCSNGTYFFTASSPMQIDDNDDPGKTPDSASFGIELDIEPELSAAGNPEISSAGQGPAGDAGVYAWRGAVTNGSKDAGFKIMLNKTKELPNDDRRGKSIRKLVFNATIVPGAPQ
ncbi:MAG: hypothetical protein ACRD9S_15310 [Pyrinomonadaceae bacterium]